MSFSEPVREDAGFSRLDADEIFAAADKEYENLFGLYRHFHANPELSGAEEETARRFAVELETAGFVVTRGVGGHGVVAVIENGGGPTIMVRADLDALPIREETGLQYASRSEGADRSGGESGFMHACGHDVHMTVLVGAARLMARLRGKWKGTLIMIGQPAEETGTGALAMIEDGLFTRFPRPDCIIALHVLPPMPAGKVGFCDGATMAGCASLELKIRGVGGHGSRPHEAKDPIVMAAETILLLQTIASREIDPKETAVVTVGSIHGGTRGNIIPDEVLLKINYRYFSPEVDRRIKAAIERIVKGVAVAADIPEDRMPVLTVEMTGPPIYSDSGMSRHMGELFRKLLGQENVMKLDPISASDDFALFGCGEPAIPLFYFWLGVSDAEQVAASAAENRPFPGIHNPAFAPLPEPTIKTGVKAMTVAVMDLLRS